MQSRTLVWHILVCSAQKQQNLVCFLVLPLVWMGHHVVEHLYKGGVVMDLGLHGEAEPCSVRGPSAGTCTTNIVRQKIVTPCLCVVKQWPIWTFFDDTDDNMCRNATRNSVDMAAEGTVFMEHGRRLAEWRRGGIRGGGGGGIHGLSQGG